MKKYILYLAMFAGFVRVSAQNIQTADYYIGLGERYSYKKQTDSAIWAFKYVLLNFPNKNQECSRAMYRIAEAYEKDSLGMALKWYNKIIESDRVNDKDKGMEIMETFANYKHNSCVRRAYVLAKRKNFEDALLSLNEAVNVYKYQTYIGSAFENRMVNIAMKQSEYYMQLGYKDSAIYILVQKIFDTNIKYRLPEMKESSAAEPDYYGKISLSVAKLIDQEYGLGSFKFELNKALKKMKVKKDKKNHWVICTFKLYNITYKITSTLEMYKKDNFINDFKASKLWAELEKG